MKMILSVGLSAVPTLQHQVLGDQMWFGLEPDLLIPSFNKYLVSISTMYQALGYIAQKTKMINTHG